MIEINKQKNKDFVVLNLADFNVSSEEMAKDCDTRKIIEGTVFELVERIKPDLITFVGDFSYGRDLSVYEILGNMLESFQIPWTFCLGNHDNEALEREGGLDTILLALTKNPHCLFEKGPAELGCGNFAIKIVEDGKPIYALLMMDSHNKEVDPVLKDKNGKPKEHWGRLWKNQLMWLEKTSLDLGVKNAIITHIPLPAYKTAFEKAWNNEYNPKEVSFLESCEEKYWNEDYKNSFGVCYEEICSYPIDDGEFEAVKKGKNTEIFLCGHDHVNCFVIDYEGVKLCYGLKTGNGCYWNKTLNGGTTLTIGNGKTKIEHIFVEWEKFLK